MMKGSLKKVAKKELVMRKEVVMSKEHHFQCDITSIDLHAELGASETASKPNKVKPMATDFTKLPFALPKKAENQEIVNKILRYSLKQQKDDDISDNTALVTHLISRCLNAAGIDHRIAYGYRRTHPTARDKENPMRFSVCPHVWLVIKDHIIDNTYIKNMPEKNCKYLCDNTPGCYQESNYNTPSEIAEHCPVECRPRAAMKKKIEFCMRRPDLGFALGHNNEHFYNYFFAMIRFMFEEFDVSVVGIDPSVRFMCWCCENYPANAKDLYSDAVALRFSRIVGTFEVRLDVVPTVPSKRENNHSWRFQQCSRCMVANYCSEQCQRRDWTENHEHMCLSRGAVFLPPISNMPYGAI